MAGSADFDFILAGAGMAGLSLAYRLPKEKRILLVDRADAARAQRTWCYWEAGEGAFEAAVHRRWDDIFVYGDDLSERYRIAPYRYKMLRGQDFYAFMDRWLEGQPHITFVQGEIESLTGDSSGAALRVNGETYRAPWAFNSALRTEPLSDGYSTLLQHFKGWMIRSPAPAFDVSAATLMDFRTAQTTDTRFVYVLPMDAHTAFVEYTVFSPALLNDAEYDAGLRAYIRDHLHLENYDILETEFGIIPMTDAPFPRLHAPGVMNIGIAGGRAKASTGYTFVRAQRQSEAIAQHLEHTGSPLYSVSAFNRHDWMDSVYLNVLLHNLEPGARFFTQLFKRNDPVQVLRFLDEQSTTLEDLRLMMTVNIPVFMRAALEVTARGLRDRG
jgi:lycopene beta-cyclase